MRPLILSSLSLTHVHSNAHLPHTPSGATVPADGVVLSGTSSINEAMITGEPMPVTKGPGSAVIGGTVNAGGGLLTMRATRVGADTALAAIARLVQEAQGNKAPVQVRGDGEGKEGGC